jgi:CBS domain-containing protein
MMSVGEEAVMKHWLYEHEAVRGDPDHLDHVLRLRVRDLLAELTGDGPELTAEGDLLARLPTRVLGHDLYKMVCLRTGVAERGDARTCIPLRWHAEPAKHLFPSFNGTIELEALSTSMTQLSVVGAATLPLGPVGGAVDAAVLGAITDRTVRYLVRGLAAALERAVTEPESERLQVAVASQQLRVRDVMTPDPLVLHEDMPIKTAALLLFHYDVAGAPVRNETGGLVGVLSEADLLDVEAPLRYGLSREVGASRRHKEAHTVGEACSRPAREITPSASVRHAAEALRDYDIARLVVVDGSEVVGLISRHDVLKVLVRDDAHIETAVHRLLADENEGDVTASVEWGVAHLSGRVYSRSGADDLAHLVSEVDGVVRVDSDLAWEVDDTTPPVPLL